MQYLEEVTVLICAESFNWCGDTIDEMVYTVHGQTFVSLANFILKLSESRETWMISS